MKNAGILGVLVVVKCILKNDCDLWRRGKGGKNVKAGIYPENKVFHIPDLTLEYKDFHFHTNQKRVWLCICKSFISVSTT